MRKPKVCIICNNAFYAKSNAARICSSDICRSTRSRQYEAKRPDRSAYSKQYLAKYYSQRKKIYSERGKERYKTNKEKIKNQNRERYYASDYNGKRMQKYRNDISYRDRLRGQVSRRANKLADMVAVLREEMPELLKEFGL